MSATERRPLNVVMNVERYGSVVGQPSPERALSIAKVLKCIIAADGAVSATELAAFLDMSVMFGLSEQQAAQFVAFDPRSTTLAQCLQGLQNDALTRRMLYDAIRISSVDGYAGAERAAVRSAARAMQIDDATVALLEGLVHAEQGVAEMRNRLLG